MGICIIDIVFVGERVNGQISQVVHLAAPPLLFQSGPADLCRSDADRDGRGLFPGLAVQRLCAGKFYLEFI